MRTTTPVTSIARVSRGEEANRLALASYEALLALLDDLGPSEWQSPTECEPWTVSDMVGHLVGAARGHASQVELARQGLWAVRHQGDYDHNVVDALSDCQVRDTAELSPAQRVEELRDLAPRAVRGRARMPAPIRLVPIPIASAGSTPEGAPGRVTVGDLMDVILTRDVLMHRIDIARATGRTPQLDPSVDGRLVADIVAEWADRHGQPFRLTLTGPAGGVFVQGDGGPELEHDTVEFLVVLAGREPGEGLLTTRVLF